jgi:hypothetical protein
MVLKLVLDSFQATRQIAQRLTPLGQLTEHGQLAHVSIELDGGRPADDLPRGHVV